METEQALKRAARGGEGWAGEAENRLQMNEPAGSGSPRREGGQGGTHLPPPAAPRPPAASTSVFTSETSKRDTFPAAERGIPPPRPGRLFY